VSPVIRPIEVDDDQRLRAFHETLSAETTRLRFFSPHPRLSDAEVRRFTHVDRHDREALVAIDDGEIVAVARFERVGTSASAEIAFVVADRWQHQGLGTELLRQIDARARAEGISRVVAETLFENHRMLGVFEHSGRLVQRTVDHGVVHIEMSP
jgi:RimJ/RimL family protein N-acetyltransferase